MVTGTKQILNRVSLGEKGTLESDLLQSCLAWQMGDTQQASTVSAGLWITGYLGLPVWPG